VTVEELGQIKAMHSRGLNYAAIGRKLHRSGTFVGQKVKAIEAGIITVPETIQTQTATQTTAPISTRENMTDTCRTIVSLAAMSDSEKVRILRLILE
jgi:hypothetical protein